MLQTSNPQLLAISQHHSQMIQIARQEVLLRAARKFIFSVLKSAWRIQFSLPPSENPRAGSYIHKMNIIIAILHF